MKSICLVSTTALVLGLGCTYAEESWTLKASSSPIKVSGKFLDGFNISGAASVKAGELILACDELHKGVQVGHFDLAKGTFSVDDKEFTLFDGAKKELDLEGAAADPEHHRYYACGSCSVSRKTGEAAPDRQWLFRIETDPKTGALLPDKVTKVSLVDAMKADAFLKEHMSKPASEMGIDVEGLAYKDGKLWFGLRSPNVNGWGFIVSASADDLMAGKPVIFQRHELPLGEDLGIRDIAPVKDGFLLITGPTGALQKDGASASAEAKTPAKKEAPAAEKESVAKAAPAKEEKESVAKAAPAKEEVEVVAKAGAAAPEKEVIAKPAVETVAKAVAPAKDKKESVAKAVPAAKSEPKTEAKAVAKTEPKTEPKAEPKTPAKAAPTEAFALYFWAGDASKPVRIGDLPRPPKAAGGKDESGKPEGLLVLEEGAEKLEVLVLNDGAENGAPVIYDISRPKRVEGPVARSDKK